MPRRLPLRPAKVAGNIFVMVLFSFIGFIYFVYAVKCWGPKLQSTNYAMPILTTFHGLFILLIWSLLQAMTTDPGQVPVFWGFHLGDPENKRRRYCLMCNVFKPERCHHCSACNRCVLNMDHHCPWINNCVGFWNRKYFMLMLFYVLAMTYFIILTLAADFFNSLLWF
jgi:palmitoyltransferase ZDHHC2/15/20